MEQELLIKHQEKPMYRIIYQQSFENLKEELSKLQVLKRKICIIADTNTAKFFLPEVMDICRMGCKCVVSYVFNAGEQQKNLNTVEDIYKLLIEQKFDRYDLLIALGGGVTGDMTGYAASTYLRGIRFIQIPTSLLAQVDSSIGGKTGVDFLQYKNMVGAFYNPSLVYLNMNTLQSLPEREFYAGMAEIIKHALIMDKDYYHWLQKNADKILAKDMQICLEMIDKSCQIKAAVVESDPTEQGPRALLNMGHTVGHAIEKLLNWKKVHGECVAIGIAASIHISLSRGYITPNEFEDILHTLKTFHLPTWLEGVDIHHVLETTKSDKKMDSGIIRFILINSIGNAEIYDDISASEFENAIGFILEKRVPV